MKLVKKYAKRAALKKIINNRKLDLSERFDSTKAEQVTKNSAKIKFVIDVRFQTTPWRL